jgi:hypothetical protein
MNTALRIPLDTTAEQQARLVALQSAFAAVCNALSPIVQQTRVWNRVALHHMAYKGLRERFPALGSQMVCNAIYSVSRASRLIFQTPGSPFHVSRLAGRPMPLLRFTDTCPVYFDRHTLSLKQGQVSMFTLDGRMKFQLDLSPQQEAAFHTRKLLEIVLQRVGTQFELGFQFGTQTEAAAAPALLQPGSPSPLPNPESPLEPMAEDGPSVAEFAAGKAGEAPPPLIFPDYLKVEDHA